MSVTLLVWLLVLAAGVCFCLAALRVATRIDCGWLGAMLGAIAVLVHLWPPS
jgi:hypothetical protein